MDEGRLASILSAEIDDAIGMLDSETTAQRAEALNYYLRNPYGNEVEGRSQIVTGEVAEAVDGALPQLMRVFTASDDIVRFEPVGPGDEETAKQATDYCNWVFYKDNPGFAILHQWFWDALTAKTGTVKAYWDERIDVTEEEYRNLTDAELALLLSDGTREIVGQSIEQEEMLGPDGNVMMGLDGQPMMSTNSTVTVRKKDKSGRVAIECVPPEEFIVSKKAVFGSEKMPFCAHRSLVPRTELVQMGFDKDEVYSLPQFNSLDFTEERIARYSPGEEPFEQESLDESMQEVEVYECYIYVDSDDDGLAELRQIYYSNQKILTRADGTKANIPVDYVPFHVICPFPIPHKFFGQSMADRTMDLQLIKSTLVRQALDNLYLSNNARVGAIEGQVNLDDLLNVTPGGVVRMKSAGAITPMVVPNIADSAFPMLGYFDNVQSKRTGVSDAQQGLDPNVLQNVTAAAVAATMGAAQGKLELIARLFAETGVKSLFKGILHLLCKYQDQPRLIRMRGKFVPMDPREWSNQYDVTISVGLGTGTKQEQMAMLQMVLAKQEQILQGYGPANPLVSVGQYRATLGRFIEAAGFKDSTEFFKEITPEIDQQLAQPPQQQQGNPALDAMMAQAQAQIQIEQQKAMAAIETQRLKAQADIQLAREKAAAELQLKQQEFQVEAQLKAAKIGAGISANVEIPG
jgi:hypothetical protein